MIFYRASRAHTVFVFFHHVVKGCVFRLSARSRRALFQAGQSTVPRLEKSSCDQARPLEFPQCRQSHTRFMRQILLRQVLADAVLPHGGGGLAQCFAVL